jgi:hypothetical protein
MMARDPDCWYLKSCAGWFASTFLVSPQSFALRLRTGGGGDLDKEFVLSCNGGTKRINQDDLAGDDVSVNEEQLRSHNFTVLYPEEANFSCVKFTGGTSLLRFFTFSGLEAVLAISAVMIFSDIQPEPHIALRMARDPDC